jgi:hypothetical protein
MYKCYNHCIIINNRDSVTYVKVGLSHTEYARNAKGSVNSQTRASDMLPNLQTHSEVCRLFCPLNMLNQLSVKMVSVLVHYFILVGVATSFKNK